MFSHSSLLCWVAFGEPSKESSSQPKKIIGYSLPSLENIARYRYRAKNIIKDTSHPGMDYRTGPLGPGPGAHELRGALNQSLCVKSLLLTFRCTCTVLANVYVRCKSCWGTGAFSYCAVEQKHVITCNILRARKEGGAFYTARPRAPWFHNPSMITPRLPTVYSSGLW